MKVKKHLLLKTVLIFVCSVLTSGYQLTRAGGMWLKPKVSSSSQSIQHRFFKKSESKLSILPLLMTEWRKANVEAEFFRSIQRFFQNLFGFGRGVNQDDSKPETITAVPKPPRKPKNAVLVFGSTGRTGQLIVQQLEQQGREVVVLGKDSKKLLSLYPDSAADHKDTNIFVTDKLVDVSDSSSLTSNIFEGVEQVVVALGPGFGGNGINNSTSYDVDYKGVENIVTAFQSQKEKTVRDPIVAPIVNFHEKGRNLTQWKRLDDVIMGGNSGSRWQEVAWNNEGSNYARWEGGVVTLGGGFCGTTYPLTSENNQHSQYDGILLKVRGDGNRYKFRLKPTSLANEYQYQAIFEPPANTWTEIKLPFTSFTAVKRNDVIYRAKPVTEHSTLENIGIIFSKFNFNERKNPSFQNIEPTTSPYPFQLEVESIQYYRDPRPEFLLISSAGSERINKLESLDEIKRDIPIVQINPQGILNWKYKGEETVRSSSLQYTIVRSTALANASLANTSDSLMSLGQKRRMEVSQGDQIAGRITREELADAVVQILNSPYTIGKTFEIRRDESVSGLLVDPSQGIINNFGHNTPNILQEKQDLNPLLQELIEDKDRGSVSVRKFLPPFPYANEPFPTPLPPITSEEKKA